jgi:hypothetical protein
MGRKSHTWAPLRIEIFMIPFILHIILMAFDNSIFVLCILGMGPHH